MTNLAFNQSLALSIYQSTEPFPINFDDAWQWLGYSNKANAKKQLARFKNNIDYSSDVMKNGQRGRSSELIMLSIDCFKHLAMMAETEAGDTIRMYFLECERIAKGAIVNTQNTLSSTDGTRLTQLTSEKSAIESRIRELRQLLSIEESKLRTASEALIKEAELYKAANTEAMKQALLCDEILRKAKQDNPFRSKC